MEPSIFQRWSVRITWLLLLMLGSGRLQGGEAMMATVALGLPSDDAWACTAEGSTLVWKAPDGAIRPMASGFLAACDATFDDSGGALFFSGHRIGDQGFRIWKIHLATEETVALTPDGIGARSPFLLPGGSIAYISQGDLFRLAPETTVSEQLTFTLAHLRAAALLPDGRILFLHRTQRGGRLFTMLPDGTWSTLWPGLDDLSIQSFSIIGRDHLLVLGPDGDLWRVSIADPFQAREAVSIDLPGIMRSLAPVDEKTAIVVAAAREAAAGSGLWTGLLRLGSQPEISEVEPIHNRPVLAMRLLESAPRADQLPSIVKPELDTGHLFVIDVARSDDPELAGLERSDVAEVRIFALERSGSRRPLLTLEPESDGSLYVQPPADTPLALEMVDRQGDLIAATRTAFWLRPNERRGCIGCHVSPAYAPPNIRPEALLKEPVRVAQPSEVSP